jgi:hypothetical protein
MPLRRRRRIALLPLPALLTLLSGCTTLYRANYYTPTLADPGIPSVACGESIGFGAKNGVALPGPGRTLLICSASQSGKWLAEGFPLPIFPVTGRKAWTDDLRWIKFGLDPGRSKGSAAGDSLVVAILSVEYESGTGFQVAPYGSRYQSRQIEARSGSPVKLTLAPGLDSWLGFPGEGDIHIEFEAAGFGRRKVRFSPDSAYGIAFLTI